MAFPQKNGPKKPDLTVIVGIGKPKPAPPKFPFEGPTKKVEEKAAPAPGPAVDEETEHELEESGGKAPAAKAQVFDISRNCGACEHFQPESSACQIVEGTFTPENGCIQYFEAKGTEALEESTEEENEGSEASSETNEPEEKA